MSRETIKATDLFSSSTSQQNIAGNRRLRLVVTGVVLLALTLAVASLHLYRLNDGPPSLNFDESAHGVDALRVLKGEHAVFFPRNWGREGMIVYAIALTTSLLGRSVLAIRLPTALACSATVFAVFWLGQILFGRDRGGKTTPWRGLVVGAVGAGLLAVSLDHVLAARLAFRAALVPSLLCLSLSLLWGGTEEREWWRVVLGGVCTGLLPYTYISARLTPILFLLFALSFLLPFRTVSRARVRAAVPLLAAYAIVTGLVAAPILIHFALYPEHLFTRSDMLSIFHPEYDFGENLRAILDSLWKHTPAFGFRSDPSTPGQPLLRPWEAFFFWLGAGVAVWRWNQGAAYRLLMLWLVILFVPSLLAGETSYRRLMGAVPAIYLLVGVGIWEAFRFVRDRLPQRSALLWPFLGGAAVSSLILVQGANTYHSYFQRWVNESISSPYYNLAWMELAQFLNEQPAVPTMVYLIPSFQHTWTFEYLYQGAAPAHIFRPSAPDFAKQVRSALAARENVSIVKVVEWKPTGVGDDSKRFAVLFSKYGRYQGSEDHAIFRIHNYSDISLEHHWTFYEELESLTVEYDGGIALQGLALGQGGEQMSVQKALELGRDRPLWMTLQWKTAPGLDVDYAISLRLYNEEGARVYQEDSVLWNPRHFPTSYWSAEAPVETLALLAVSADLPYGDYELRVVVYDFETQVPTVQESVWEPELTLARLRLAEVQ